MKKIKFKEEEITILINRDGYGRDKHSMTAFDHLGYPYMMITINDNRIQPDEVLIKNYSENHGILDVLLENDIIHKPHRFLSSGFVVAAPVVRIKINF